MPSIGNLYASFKQYFLNYKYLLFSNKIKLNIGSGTVRVESEWFLSDYPYLNILSEKSWFSKLLFFKADCIMAEHVWEHFDLANGKVGALNCYNFLKKGGTFRIAVPDGFHPDNDYIEYVKPGGYGLGADDHKVLYNYKSLNYLLEEIGFEVILLEYWDENHQFHYLDWDEALGKIQRSSKNDSRNQSGNLKYTSLIIDARKR